MNATPGKLLQLLCLSLVLGTVLCGITIAAGPDSAQVKLKSKTLVLPSAENTERFLKALAAHPGGALHGLVILSAHPTAKQRAALDGVGIHVLSPLRETTYRVRVDKTLDMVAFASTELYANLLPHFFLLDWRDRVDPPLREATDLSLDVTVRVHTGVAVATVQEMFEAHIGPIVPQERQSDQTWMVRELPRENLQLMAAEDAVMWINRTPPPSKNELDVTRKTINVESVQKFDARSKGSIRGLGGKGVQVGVFDDGIDESHGDLSSGRVIRNDGGISDHGTQMAGIIAGNGRMSDRFDSCGTRNGNTAYRWRGMAPLAELIDIPRMRPYGKNGANAASHLHHIRKFGMDVSNHSYGFQPGGDYDNTNALRDEIMRGNLKINCDTVKGCEVLPGRLHVTSTGNNGLFFSLTKQVKNALVVGHPDIENWDGSVRKSSRGPTRDGRIKPDVVAPGSLLSTGFCTGPAAQCFADGPLCNPAGDIQRQSHYTDSVGSSGASAAATGVIALLLEQFAKRYRVDLDKRPPLPSTLRAVMVHSAGASQSPPGGNNDARAAVSRLRPPDFEKGWGLIDAQAAVRVVKNRKLVEAEIRHTCEKITYSFHVPATSTGAVRITLGWDDVAGDPALDDVLPKLVNDLDLVLIDPGNRHHYPWQLDQYIVNDSGEAIPNGDQQCGKPVRVRREFQQAGDGHAPPVAIHGGRDHLNNIEVVEAKPMPGTWRAVVAGFSLPAGPQSFSLVGATFSPAGQSDRKAPGLLPK